MSHHHVESVQEAVFNNCSGVNPVQFFVDNPTSQVYAFVNSATDESFRVQLSNNDLAPDAYQLPSSVQTPFFGMYEITSAVQNTNGYTLYVSAANNTSTGWCSVRIVEKTQLAVYLGFTTDPSRDSPSQTLRYATALHPVLHVSSQLQSDVQPTLMTFNIDGSTRYKAIGVRRMPTCRYESFFEEVLTCSEPNDYFISTVLIKTNETTIQRSQRVYCFADVGACLNGGTINADNKCVCPSNFNGGKCENPICQNDGLVVNFKCQCSASFTGEFCQYVVCDNWNYLETHDVRQHEFRQITFVVERNIAMVMPSIYLQQMIASFVAASESNDIPKQYSLITFDENVVTNVVSTSNADRFLNAFNNALNNFTNSNPISTKLVDAIQEAYKISIQPPSLIYAFTSHNASKVSTSFLKQQLGIQVNVFFMQTTDFPQQPSGFYVPMIVRQSGGRLLPLTVLATRNIADVLISAISENALIDDDGFNDCSSPQTVEFFVESTAARVVLDITGNGVSVAGAVSIFDGKGAPVNFTAANALLSDSAALVVELGKFNLQQAKAAGGQWTVSLSTVSGSCFIQVRADSPVHVIPGFTSSRGDDFVKSGPFSKLGTNSSVYVTARVTNSLVSNYGVSMDSMTIFEADYSAPWNDRPLMGTSVHLRDPRWCSSQFITDDFTSPTTTYQRYAFFGTDANGTKFQRTFFFSQPTQSDSQAQCLYGNRNSFGECNCDSRHSGDYCDERVCMNGGTPSVGVCVCANGFTGDFCENGITRSTMTSPTVSLQ
ncbi:hypothetical protein Q1695_006672 [Nippostrongylus brasiliensis]|nr:hypothetical protein Q1695_006672 [Nippostrongylus brasiliensis]